MTSILMLSALALAAGPAGASGSVTYVVVFDFACPAGAPHGSQLADSVRLRLRRHEGLNVIDRLTTAEHTPAGGVSLKTPDGQVIKLLKQRLAAQLAVFGQVQKAGRTVRAEVRCIDVSGSKPAAWTKVFSDDTEQARGQIARRIVEAIRGRAEWTPPQYGDEVEPKKFGRPLNANGGFEAGRKGWAGPDNVSTRLVADPRPGRKGKVLRIFTDLEREAWLKYQHDLRLGKADPIKPPKIGTVTNKYATVAGLEGVHYRSDWVEATPGRGTPNARDRVGGPRRYWLVADMKGRTAGIFFPKVFVKGFADFSAVADGLSEVSLHEMKMSADDFAKLPPAERRKLIADDARKHPARYRREVYRWYLACRNEENVWKHYAAPFPPRGGLPKVVQWLRIDVYAYWPPGEFLFDDVHLCQVSTRDTSPLEPGADPRRRGPLNEEKPRTPGYKPPSTRPAAHRRRGLRRSPG